jgi:hypothetical protein
MTELDTAWQGALAAEHEAVFAYGLLGPRLTSTELAVACADAHETLRDATTEAIASAGLVPVPPASDYPQLYPVPDADAARTLAVRVEDNCATTWRYLYLVAASTSGVDARRLRSTAQDALTASAVRAVRWRMQLTPKDATRPFPGTTGG